jgi:hypothetical protein
MMKLREVVRQLKAVADQHPNIDFVVQLHASHDPDDVSIANELVRISVDDDHDGSGPFCCMYVETGRVA